MQPSHPFTPLSVPETPEPHVTNLERDVYGSDNNITGDVEPDILSAHGKRGEIFSEFENLICAKSYAYVSENPISSNNQTGEDLWSKIHSVYCRMIDEENCVLEHRARTNGQGQSLQYP